MKIFLNRLLLLSSLLVLDTNAQVLPPFKSSDTAYQPMSLNTYLTELQDKNPNVKIRKLNSDSANSIAKDAGRPNLNPLITYARGSIYTQAPYTGYTNPASNTLGAMVTIEGWGKRSAREAHAQAEANKQLADMVNETQTVEGQAIFNYIDALRTKLLWQSYQAAIDSLKSIPSPEASSLQKQYLSAQKVMGNDLKYYSFALLGLLNAGQDQLPLPVGTLNIPTKNFKVSDLIQQGLENRGDISSSKASIDSASANLELIKANKNVDFLPGVYYTETPSYASGGIGYGAQKSFSFLLSVPLGNGLMRDSDLISASNSITEQEVNFSAAKTKVVTEINQTYLQYQSSKERLESALNAHNHAKTTRNNGLQGISKYHDAEYELIDARTVHAKTLILLQRLSGNFEIPNLN